MRLSWAVDISMLPIPNFMLPMPPTSIAVPSTLQAKSNAD